jgi:hypothetical protein
MVPDSVALASCACKDAASRSENAGFRTDLYDVKPTASGFMERAMGIEPASEACEGVDESGSLVPQLKGKTRVSELIPRGHGPGCPQTRNVSVTVLKCGDSDQKRRQAQIICLWAG